MIARRDRIALHVTAGSLAVLMLAPLLRPGYVLSYDMVFVPRQGLQWELVAPSGGLPRAVPEDLVVSLLNIAMPGWLLQRIALFGIVYAAALGAGRLVPAQRLLTRLVAAVAYTWSPFMAERLLLGQWGLLLVYAGLPWVVAGALRVRAGQPGGFGRTVVAAAVCALTPTGGLIAAVTAGALSIRRGAVRQWLPTMLAVIALNAPWVATALTAAASGRSDPAGVPAFAARGENWAGPLVALAGTGGAWNAFTTPASRASVAVPFVTAAFVVLAAFGIGPLRRRWPDGAGTAVMWLAAGGFVAAALGSVPGAVQLLEWAVRVVPGAGLLRDGQKFIVPYALALALTLSLGGERLAGRLAADRARLVLGALLLLPLIAMPDLAFGAFNTLRPVSYPADWDNVSAIIARSPGPVLSMPFNEYRSFAWNNRRTVLDPATRYLPAPVLTDDDLIVGTHQISGENPQAAAVRTLLSAGEPVSRTGMPWILVEKDAGGSIPASALTGLQRIYTGTSLDLYANPQATPLTSANTARHGLIAACDVLALLVLSLATASLFGLPTPW